MVMVASVCIVCCVRGGDSLSWQRVPLSRLALPVIIDVQYSAAILYSAVIFILIFPIVCLCALTLYPARADCAAATDVSDVSGRWQLSR